MIVKNGKTVAALYHGGSPVTAVYHGSNLVFSSVAAAIATISGLSTQAAGAPTPNNIIPVQSVDSLTIQHISSSGTVKESIQIIPPRPLDALTQADICDVAAGKWRYRNGQITLGTGAYTPNNCYGSGTSAVPQIDANRRPKNSETAKNSPMLCDMLAFSDKSAAAVANTVTHPYSDGRICLYLDGYKGYGTGLTYTSSSALCTAVSNILKAKLPKLVYQLAAEETEDIDADVLSQIRGLKIRQGESIVVTDNHGRELAYSLSD